MRILKFLRRRPLAVLGALALAFVVWLWRDALDGPGVPTDPQPPSSVVHAPPLRKLPAPGLDDGPARPRPDPRGTAQGIAKLKPGMTRSEVEGLVGAPDPERIYPATVADGVVTYSTSYEADLGPLSTVRPIRPHPKLPVPPVRDSKVGPPSVVTLQFDATKPGHPLLGIYYPDPLF
jgi:hypothetical protein